MILQRKMGNIKKVVSRYSLSKNSHNNFMGRVKLRMEIKEGNIGILERNI